MKLENYCKETQERLRNKLSENGIKNGFKKGKEHPNWKGGYLSLFNLRNSYKYRLWRSDVLTRDHHACQICGNRGNITVHHIKGFEDILKEYNIHSIKGVLECEELWNINNGVTLCAKCHYRVHSPYVKAFKYKGYSVLTSHNKYYVK